jgi:two-component system, NtrC family, nitrogen regulation sensor histidine kinase NtrY
VSLRARMLIYLIGLHAVFFVLTLLQYREQPIVVVAVEGILLLSLALGVLLIGRALQPLDYAKRFHELLQDQNYAARLQQAPDDELAGIVGLFNRMLDALYQERLKLGEQRGFLDRLLEATPSAVIAFDFDARISLINASAITLLGLTNAQGRPLSDWLSGEGAFVDTLDASGRQRSLDMLRQLDALPPGESRLLTDADGRRYRCQRNHFFDRGFARHFLLIEELTQELESSEKATYEKLVRVLAHEVNNTVAATGSVLDSLLFYQPQLSDTDRVDFSTAIDAVKRRNASLGEFIDRFSRVVKMPAAEPHPTDLREVMDDILRLYREQCRSLGIRIEWLRCDAIPAQAVDRNLLEQALLNIVKNAVEAVDATQKERAEGGGYVHLELAQEEGRVRLSVIDSGDRLGEVPAGQMFTPFFTTKKGGQGIGLLFVREVMNRHGLVYRLAATGQGETRFDIWFPAAFVGAGLAPARV